jgi:hypothetical protein
MWMTQMVAKGGSTLAAGLLSAAMHLPIKQALK